MLISQLAPSRNDASSCGPQNPKSSKVSDDTNSEEDICIPAIYVKVVTLDLNLLMQTNKQTKFACELGGNNGKYTNYHCMGFFLMCTRKELC